MARQLVVLALVLIAVLGLASAQAPASAPAAFSAGAASSPVDDNTIGAIDEGPVSGDEAVEAPIGGPIPEGAFPPTEDGPAQAPSAASGATITEVSAIAAAAAVAGYFF